MERHRDAFIVARGALRMLLARYAERSFGDLAFVYGPKGKPSLAGNPLDFNLSHTDGVAVFAFARRCELGVDVERIRAVPDMIEIAERFFCRGESDELRGLPDGERNALSLTVGHVRNRMSKRRVTVSPRRSKTFASRSVQTNRPA